MSQDNFVASIKDADLPEGTMRAVRVKGQPILLVKTESAEVFAVSNRCPHMGCELQGGTLTDYTVMCPCHGWKFDVRNGQYLSNPLTTLQSYRCKIENGKIFIEAKRQW